MPNIECRVHYAYDGSVVYLISGAGALIAQSLPNRQKLETTPVITSGELTGFNGVAVNFPVAASIKKIGVKVRSPGTIGYDVTVSSDSTNGVDGTWTNVLALSSPPPDRAYTEYGLLELSCTWLKLKRRDTSQGEIFSCFLFGEYNAPRFEFYNEAGSEELSGNYPLTFPNASNLNDYSQVQKFRIKNTTAAPHTYSLQVNPLRSGGDTVITTNFKLSLDNGANKFNSVTTAQVQPGELSDVVSLFADVLRASNPADGDHYWYVDAMEAT